MLAPLVAADPGDLIDDDALAGCNIEALILSGHLEAVDGAGGPLPPAADRGATIPSDKAPDAPAPVTGD